METTWKIEGSSSGLLEYIEPLVMALRWSESVQKPWHHMETTLKDILPTEEYFPHALFVVLQSP